jgi:hypothetical protein
MFLSRIEEEKSVKSKPVAELYFLFFSVIPANRLCYNSDFYMVAATFRLRYRWKFSAG